MNDQLQVTTIRHEEQQEVLELLSELRGWQDLGVDILEAAALSDKQGLHGCVGAIAEMLRGQRQRVIVLREPTSIVGITTSNGQPPSPGMVKAAKEIAEAVAAEKAAATNGPVMAPETSTEAPVVAAAPPEPEPTERSAPVPRTVAPKVAEDDLHKPSMGTRRESCTQDIRAIIATMGGITAPSESFLAHNHNLSLNQVQKLVEEEQKRVSDAATRAAKRAAASEQTPEVPA